MSHKASSQRSLSRFLLASNLFARLRSRVKVGAFVPPRNGRLSVFDTTSLAEARIWELGHVHVAGPRAKQLHGRADLGVDEVERESLRVEEAPPPPEHADVVGWPEDDGLREAIALRLAKRSRLVVNPAA
jgi:hypothetical protein